MENKSHAFAAGAFVLLVVAMLFYAVVAVRQANATPKASAHELGVPPGGTVGQALVKTSSTNGLSHWAAVASGNVTGPASATATVNRSTSSTVMQENWPRTSRFTVTPLSCGPAG